MTCLECPLIRECSGIGACAANRKYMGKYLEKHPGKIIAGNLARQICNMGKRDEDQENQLQELKDTLFSLSEQKQTDLFRLARRILSHGGSASLASEIREEAWKLARHPEILLDDDGNDLKYAYLI